MPLLVEPAWLEAHLSDPALRVIDASWYLPAQNRDGKKEYLEAHIPGAVHFDIDEISDRSSPLPHMMPSADQFARQVGKLGISEDKTIIVYDGSGLFAAPRVWWMLRVFGGKDVRVLDGGFPRWKAEGRPTESGEAKPREAVFRPRFDARAVADTERVRRALDSGAAQVVDARSAERFSGAAPEIRPGIRSGHMPGALNAPSSTLIDNGRLKSPAELAKSLKNAGLDTEKPVITSCGSGVSAAIISLALDELGRSAEALYDGSWTQWASAPGNPVATGPAKP